MLMLTKTHAAVVAAKDAEIGDLLERLGSADQKFAHANNQLWLSSKTHREAHEAMTLLTCQLAEARVEIAGLSGCMLPEKAKLVLEQMHADCGYSISLLSSYTEVPEKEVRAIVRGFAAFGWAFMHPFFSEDDNLIHGSGYSLTNEGWDVRQALIARREAATLARAGDA